MMTLFVPLLSFVSTVFAQETTKKCTMEGGNAKCQIGTFDSGGRLIDGYSLLSVFGDDANLAFFRGGMRTNDAPIFILPDGTARQGIGANRLAYTGSLVTPEIQATAGEVIAANRAGQFSSGANAGTTGTAAVTRSQTPEAAILGAISAAAAQHRSNAVQREAEQQRRDANRSTAVLLNEDVRSCVSVSREEKRPAAYGVYLKNSCGSPVNVTYCNQLKAVGGCKIVGTNLSGGYKTTLRPGEEEWTNASIEQGRTNLMFFTCPYPASYRLTGSGAQFVCK